MAASFLLHCAVEQFPTERNRMSADNGAAVLRWLAPTSQRYTYRIVYPSMGIIPCGLSIRIPVILLHDRAGTVLQAGYMAVLAQHFNTSNREKMERKNSTIVLRYRMTSPVPNLFLYCSVGTSLPKQ